MNTTLQNLNATLEYTGKSKDIYGLPNGNILMVFGDSFTGTNGVEDPGGNQNIGKKAGLGRQNLEVSSYLFDLISVKLGIPTHQISVNLDENMIEVQRAKTLGKGMTFDGIPAEGLEFISRNKAWGSFLKRNPSVKQGDSMLDQTGAPFVEVSIKNDQANDPFFSRDTYIKNGISAQDYDTCVQSTKKITTFLTSLFAACEMELIDMKIEFGKNKSGEVILLDEISPGSLRALVKGQSIAKDVVHEKLMQYKTHENVGC